MHKLQQDNSNQGANIQSSYWGDHAVQGIQDGISDFSQQPNQRVPGIWLNPGKYRLGNDGIGQQGQYQVCQSEDKICWIFHGILFKYQSLVVLNHCRECRKMMTQSRAIIFLMVDLNKCGFCLIDF